MLPDIESGNTAQRGGQLGSRDFASSAWKRKAWAA
jgi:hypothetical protein